MIEQEVAIKLNDHDHEIGSLKYRVKSCEEHQGVLSTLAEGVQRLAINMEHMQAELTRQWERLERLEQVPADDSRYYKRLVIGCIITSVLGLLAGALVSKLF